MTCLGTYAYKWDLWDPKLGVTEPRALLFLAASSQGVATDQPLCADQQARHLGPP